MSRVLCYYGGSVLYLNLGRQAKHRRKKKKKRPLAKIHWIIPRVYINRVYANLCNSIGLDKHLGKTKQNTQKQNLLAYQNETKVKGFNSKFENVSLHKR